MRFLYWCYWTHLWLEQPCSHPFCTQKNSMKVNRDDDYRRD